MNNFIKQQAEERAVFENFMRVCEYSIIKESIQQQNPPSPDIFCKLEIGIAIEFELANSIDPELAQKMNDEKVSDKGGFCNDEPIERIIWNKNQKLKEGKYTLHAGRFELLIYLGMNPVWPYWQRTIPQFLEKNKNHWGFDGIWIFRDCQENPKVLWFYQKSDCFSGKGRSSDTSSRARLLR